MQLNIAIVLILTVGFTLASLLGYLSQRIKLPSLIGYLIAGYLIGPYSPGFVADLHLSEQLAEIGVILMLFGVGLHFKLEDLFNVKKVAIPGALIQTATATIAALILTYLLGWSFESSLIIGLSIAVASTVVLIRVLMDNHILNTIEGHIAIGWLVVEDILTIIILILLPTFTGFISGNAPSFSEILWAIALVIGKFSFLALLMFTWGQKIVRSILTAIARVHSQELLTLTALALVFVIATGSSFVFGTSIALGAFIAGLLIGQTTLHHQVAANASSLKDVFAVIFFLSVGMLFNPSAIAANWLLFLAIIGVILIVKPLSAFLIVRSFGYSLKVALTVAIALAQIGEFSFILAEQALELHLLPDSGFDIIVACALVSISLNPLLFQWLGHFENRLRRFKFYKVNLLTPIKIEKTSTSEPAVVVVGFGPIGKEVVSLVAKAGFLLKIIEQNVDTVSNHENQDRIIFGDASQISILQAAHLETAKLLVITIPDTHKTAEIIRSARQLNPNISILSRIKYVSEQPLMDALQVSSICAEQEERKAFSTSLKKILGLNLAT